MSEARLLKRVFDFDIVRCTCGGQFKIIAAIEEPAVIARILTHLGLPARARPRAQASSLALFNTPWATRQQRFPDPTGGPARPAFGRRPATALKCAALERRGIQDPVKHSQFSASPLRLTACRAHDTVAAGEKGGLKILSTGPPDEVLSRTESNRHPSAGSTPRGPRF